VKIRRGNVIFSEDEKRKWLFVLGIGGVSFPLNIYAPVQPTCSWLILLIEALLDV